MVEKCRLLSMNLFAATLATIRSALTSILARVTGNPEAIDEIRLSVDRDSLEAIYRFLGIEKILVEAEKLVDEGKGSLFCLFGAVSSLNRLSNQAGPLIAISGILVLSVVGCQISWDLTHLGKSVDQVLLEPRSGQFMSLGLGLRVIHYLLAGIALITDALFIDLRSIPSK